MLTLTSLALAAYLNIEYPVFCLKGPGPSGKIELSCDGTIDKSQECVQIDRKGVVLACKGIPDGWIEV